MLDRIKALIFNDGADDATVDGSGGGTDDVQVAAVALLIEAAVIDGDFDEAERKAIAGLIESRFAFEGAEVEELIALGEEAVENSNQLYAFTRVVKALPKNRSVSMRVLREGRASFITFKLAE